MKEKPFVPRHSVCPAEVFNYFRTTAGKEPVPEKTCPKCLGKLAIVVEDEEWSYLECPCDGE